MGSEVVRFLVWLIPAIPQLVEAFQRGELAKEVIATNKAAWKAAKSRVRG